MASDWRTQVSRLYPVLLAGGAGAGLWPMSRLLYPKQFQPLSGERSLLQQAATRFAGRPDFAPPVVVCHHEHRFIVAEQLGDANVPPFGILLEPEIRDTGIATLVAAMMLRKRDPDAVMVLMPTDQTIADPASLEKAIDRAVPAALEGRVVLLASRGGAETPRHFALAAGKLLDKKSGLCAVAAVGGRATDGVVSDDEGDAERILFSDIMLVQSGRLIDLMAKAHPALSKAAADAVAAGGRDLIFYRLGDDAYQAAPTVSVEAILAEHLSKDHLGLIDVEMGWRDFDSWQTLWAAGPRDEDDNAVFGDVITHDTSNSLIRADRALIATLGVKDLVVVATDDVVVVADRGRLGELRKMVADLRAAGRREADAHSRAYRPWGHIDSIAVGENFEIKMLTVRSHASLALQLHHHRAKHWVVVSGTARVTRGDRILVLSENQSIFIPIGMPHKLENPGKLPLKIVQVQSGTYFGSDDVIRIDEPYRRPPRGGRRRTGEDDAADVLPGAEKLGPEGR
ncbi:MAG: mannose-1-phosphate guanylyltransferase/mannose-6-phosphate isomerase [Sneathiellaceae bacterium]